MLVEARKTRIAREEFEATLARRPKVVPPDPWRRLSGVHSLRGLRPLAVARELWLERDAFARERDIAPGRLIPDASIIAVARNIPTSLSQLSGRRDFTGRASRGEVERWWSAIERGTTTEDLPSAVRPAADTLPPPRAWGDRNPAADARLKAGRAVVIEIAELLSLPVENLLTPELLRRSPWSPPEPLDAASVAAELERAGARSWQIDATAASLATAFVEAGQAPGGEHGNRFVGSGKVIPARRTPFLRSTTTVSSWEALWPRDPKSFSSMESVLRSVEPVRRACTGRPEPTTWSSRR
ncbi:HRDC domain-containing protein [Rathayibacter oskolensis]|uniref:HRDC domain-containing protein n=1 Tax=Rathayibacter oskolensis TaxID=1891671 RepID=UPI003F5D4F75